MTLNPEEFEIPVTKRMDDVRAFMGRHAEGVHTTALALTHQSTQNARILIDSAVLELVTGYSDEEFRRDFYNGSSALEDEDIARLVTREMKKLAPRLFGNDRGGPAPRSR